MSVHISWPEAPAARQLPKADVSLAMDIVLALVKTAKGLRMYLPNNPFLKKFLDELMGKLREYHMYYGDFRLDCSEMSLDYKGEVLYQGSAANDSIPFRLYADGIRSVVFTPGIKDQELCSFLDTVTLAAPGDGDDDIVTRLWLLALPHLSLVLAEDFIEVEEQVDQQHPVGGQQEQIRLLYQSLPPVVPPQLPTIPLELLFLSAEEAKSLRTDRVSDEKGDAVTEVIAILATVLTSITDPELYRSFLDIALKIAAHQTESGDIKAATRLIELLHRLTVSDTVSSDFTGMAAQALSRFLAGATISSLRKAIDTTEDVTPMELHSLLLLLGKQSLPGMCELLGQVERMKMRKVVLEVLIELGKDEPQAFLPLLSDSRWYLVRNVVLILNKLKDPRMLDAVAGLISYRDQRVRKEVLTYLEQIQDPRAKSYLLKFLRDESQALRIRTLQILAETRFTFALNMLTSMVNKEGFEKVAMAEKTVIFETIGCLGQERMLPLFRAMLSKRHRFNRSKRHDAAVCAIAGIRKVGGQNAIQVLEEGLRGRDPVIHNLILQGIAAMKMDLDKSSSTKKCAC